MVLNIVVAIIAILILGTFLLVFINILQKGPSRKDGRSMEAILGMPADQAGPEDLKKLGKADLMQLFYAAATPDFNEIKGEYRGEIVPVGVTAFVADYFINHLFGSGRWVGKGFNPVEPAAGWGYNLFAPKEHTGEEKINRMRKMDTSIGPSRFTEGDSFHLNYSAHNKGNVGTMRDEIRKINDQLFLGLGYMALGGGSINPALFMLQGPPKDLKI